MYLDNSSIEEASGVYPIDDDDYASASGSGKAGYVHAHLCVLCLCKHVRVRARAHTHTHTHTHYWNLLRGDRQLCTMVKSMLCGVTASGCEF